MPSFLKKTVTIQGAMLDRRTAMIDAAVLEALAVVYNECESKKWNFSGIEIANAPGRVLVEAVVASKDRLENLFSIIGEGLCKNNPHAEKASQLIKELYLSGLKNPSRLESIQNRFNELVSEQDMEELKNGFPMDEFLKARASLSSLTF